MLNALMSKKIVDSSRFVASGREWSRFFPDFPKKSVKFAKPLRQVDATNVKKKYIIL